MSTYKLCILAAGKGTRSTKYNNLHKALLPIENRPAISLILDTIDKEVPIVIALGHLGQQIEAYLNYVHHDRKIEYTWIDNYDKPGSGPGYSLMQCKDKFQCPFIVIAVDTIIEEKLECPKENWIGVKRTKNCKNYCLFSQEKGFYYDEHETNGLAFIGIGGIIDYELFWENLANKKTIKNEHQMTNGFENMPLSLKEFTWHDVGNDSAYNQTKNAFNRPIVAEKESEILYIDKNKVVKFFSDANKIKKRIERMQNYKCSPLATQFNDNMYGYSYIDGITLSQANESQIDLFFNFCDDFLKTDGKKTENFKNDCRSMYKNKTFYRVQSLIDSALDKLNNLPLAADLLDMINWEEIINKSIPYLFHGDFQTENIIISDSVKLIDWRDSFGDSTIYGDIYYDLGKLHHSILIIGMNNYQDPLYNGSLLNKFKSFCIKHNLDWSHIELLGALQYVTIASLYRDATWRRFYFLLGKRRLTELLFFAK